MTARGGGSIPFVTDEPIDVDLVPVRATVGISGLSVGSVVLVDPTDPEIADLMNGEILVRVEGQAAISPDATEAASE